VLQKLQAGARQPHAARQPHEQLRAELFLDGAHMAAQGWLRDAEVLRSARNAAQLCDLNEVTNAAQVHGMVCGRGGGKGRVER
jgi:hypothetical protein